MNNDELVELGRFLCSICQILDSPIGAPMSEWDKEQRLKLGQISEKLYSGKFNQPQPSASGLVALDEKKIENIKECKCSNNDHARTVRVKAECPRCGGRVGDYKFNTVQPRHLEMLTEIELEKCIEQMQGTIIGAAVVKTPRMIAIAIIELLKSKGFGGKE